MPSKFVLLILVLGCFAPGMQRVSAEIIPPTRRIQWQAGVQGGIPQRTTIFCNVKNPPYNAKGDGVTDDSAAIQSAIRACPSNQVVYLPTGNYLITNQINIYANSYWTLRGDGPGKTILTGGNYSGKAVIYLGQSPWLPPATADLVSGYTQGSTNLVLSTVSGIATNILLYLDQLNDGVLVDSSGASAGNGPCTYLDRLHNGTRNVMQLVKVTAIQGNTVTFWPPLNWTFSAALAPQAVEMYPSVRLAGLEDLTVTAAPGADIGQLIFFDTCEQSWLKNVETSFAPHWHFMAYTCLNCELRDCYVHEAQTYGVDDGYGIETRMSTGFLIENNILWHCFVSMMVTACNGCVIGYNYVTQTYNSDPTYMQSGFFGCHGAHPFMNLYEGNYGNEFQTDFYWGSSSHQTLFRNYFTGTDVDVVYNRIAVSLDSHSISNNVVGNVLGSPGLSWVARDTNAFFSENVIWRLGFPTIGNNSYTNVYPPATNVEALDLHVPATLLSHGNYDAATRAVSWDPTIADHTIPASLYLTAKPAWFGTLPWPPFDPANAAQATATNLPAAYRFVFGTEPPASLAALQLVRLTNGWGLSLSGAPTTSYQLQRAGDLSGPWVTRATLLTDGAGNASWLDTNAPVTQSFYRALEP